MTTTEYLKLALSGTSDADLDQTFLEWRQKINGEGNKSNMEIIDAAIKSIMLILGSTIKTINNLNPDSDGNLTLDAASVHARPDTWTPTAEEVHARPDTWVPNAEAVGAAPTNHSHDKLEYIDQDVKKNASPTFDTVTANKVIGAVYA